MTNLLLEKIRETAIASGATNTAIFSTGNVQVRDEVRDMCNADRCQSYGKNWQCPPAVGTIESWREEMTKWPVGLLVQVTLPMNDPFDTDAMLDGQHKIDEVFAAVLKAHADERDDFLPLGAGTCTVCETCAYPDEECRFPEMAIPSLEAVGYLVTELCEEANLPYYYGPLTMTYTGAFFFKE